MYWPPAAQSVILAFCAAHRLGALTRLPAGAMLVVGVFPAMAVAW